MFLTVEHAHGARKNPLMTFWLMVFTCSHIETYEIIWISQELARCIPCALSIPAPLWVVQVLIETGAQYVPRLARGSCGKTMENPVPCSRTQASYLLGTRHGWTMWAAWKDFTSNLSNILYNIFLLYLYNTYIYIINILYYMRYKYYIIIYNIIYICHWFNLFPVFPHVSRGPHFLRSQDTRRLQREGGSSPLRDVPRPL